VINKIKVNSTFINILLYKPAGRYRMVNDRSFLLLIIIGLLIKVDI